MTHIIRYAAIISLLCIPSFAENDLTQGVIREMMTGREGTCVFINCTSGEILVSDSVLANTRLTPCSTFKIWNTLIGLECKTVSSPDEPFYKWDSVPQYLPAWNKDLTLKEAFQVSCVPAFQNLARKTGYRNMKVWIDSLGYGDKDISSGIDDFWLPREGKKSIKISPLEQAQLIMKLVNNELPFSSKSTLILQEIMLVAKTTNGIYYGKTGTGNNSNNKQQNIAWYVGYVKSEKNTFSFTCTLLGADLTGKDSKVLIETILRKSNLI